MLKINISDVVKVLTVDESGVCEDGSNRTWVRCSCLSFFDEEETYMTLTAFGYVADMILDNHTGENMRRAFVNGSLEIVKGSEIVKVKFNGVTKSVAIPNYQFRIIANDLRFIDKNNWGEHESEVEFTDDNGEDEVLDLTGASGSNKIETAATDGDVNYVDDDSEEAETGRRIRRERVGRRNSNGRSARDRGIGRRVKRVVPE